MNQNLLPNVSGSKFRAIQSVDQINFEIHDEKDRCVCAVIRPKEPPRAFVLGALVVPFLLRGLDALYTATATLGSFLILQFVWRNLSKTPIKVLKDSEVILQLIPVWQRIFSFRSFEVINSKNEQICKIEMTKTNRTWLCINPDGSHYFEAKSASSRSIWSCPECR